MNTFSLIIENEHLEVIPCDIVVEEPDMVDFIEVEELDVYDIQF